ncbi:MAG: uncharacterized protein K0S08_379 [Gammaproteobacteria bacterium]|jgi:hypothetical protein|nr:uncharacterized protein [Gammaproteobacteria bacterium]
MKKFKTKSVISAISVAALSLLAANAFAQDTAPASAGTDNAAMIDKINKELTAQEQVIKSLRSEISALKKQTATANATAQKAATQAAEAHKTTDKSSKLHQMLLESGASPVITAPYLGVPARFDASDLIVNFPTFNEDVLLMQRDAAIDQALRSKGFQPPQNPILELSGKVEAQAWDTRPLSGPTQSSIDLSGAEVDFAVHVTDWVNGLAALAYDNAPPNSNGSTNAQLISNSRVFLKQGFITLGNLDKSPWYGTIGQRTVPFGHGGTNLISDTYPMVMYKTRERSVLFGYHPMSNQLGPYATAYAFHGDAKAGANSSNIDNYGTDLGYLFCHGLVTGDFGFGGIANVADSLGMQTNGLGSGFRGFGYSPNANISSETLVRKVPGATAHGTVNVGNFTFSAEGSTATSAFASQDLSFNNHGAKPAAAHGEIDYSFNIGQYPSNVGVAYDHSWQGLALAIPQARYAAAFNTSFFKDTIESLEVKRETNYPASDTASGQTQPVVISGHYSNTVTAQIGYYF